VKVKFQSDIEADFNLSSENIPVGPDCEVSEDDESSQVGF
jgi:hypothetical protein